MQLLTSKLGLIDTIHSKKETAILLNNRICDEEEDIPLHLRVKPTRSVPYPNSMIEEQTKPAYNIDEYVYIHIDLPQI